MTSADPLEPITPPASSTCLIVRRGSARRSVVSLRPGEITTIGRAHSNRIVIPDAKCSRHHCEIFYSEGLWHIRDLASRNGVLIDGVRLEREQPLEEGQILTIGNCDIEFTARGTGRIGTGASLLDDAGSEPFDIIERKSGTQYDRPAEIPRDVGRTSPGLQELYRLARAMAEANDLEALAERTLDGLFKGTSAAVGAVLVLPALSDEPSADELECLAAQLRRSEAIRKCRGISRNLS